MTEYDSKDALDHMVIAQEEEDDDGVRLTLRQIRHLINRAVMLMELDLEWDVDEGVDGNQWHRMPITELVERLGEDFQFKLIDEYQVMVSEGELNTDD